MWGLAHTCEFSFLHRMCSELLSECLVHTLQVMNKEKMQIAVWNQIVMWSACWKGQSKHVGCGEEKGQVSFITCQDCFIAMSSSSCSSLILSPEFCTDVHSTRTHGVQVCWMVKMVAPNKCTLLCSHTSPLAQWATWCIHLCQNSCGLLSVWKGRYVKLELKTEPK